MAKKNFNIKNLQLYIFIGLLTIVTFWGIQQYQQNQLLLSVTEETQRKTEETQKKNCKGTLIDGECVYKSCIDSDVNEKPNDIFIKGKVSYTDENGVERELEDQCNGSGTQVNEMWCYGQNSGDYVNGRMVYDCPLGCFNGACRKN